MSNILNKKSFLLFLLLFGSTIQFGDYIGNRYFVPLLSLFSVIIFLPGVKSLKKINIFNELLFIHLFSYTFFVILSVIGHADFEDIFFDMAKLFVSFSMSFILILLVLNVTDKSLKKIVDISSISVIFVLSLEFYIRFSNVNFDSIFLNLHLLKIDSPFFFDSNAVAFYGIFYFILFYYYNNNYLEKKSYFNNFTLLMIAMLIIGTLSRSAIITLFIIIIWHYYFFKFKFKLKFKFIYLLVFLVFTLLFIKDILLLIQEDLSGSTKLEIYRIFLDKFFMQDIRGGLFGYGINLGNYVYSYKEGRYSHALIPMITGYFGFIGVILYFCFFIYFAIITKGHSLFAFLTAFIIGLSYLHPFLETFFLAHGFIVGLYLRKARKKVISE